MIAGTVVDCFAFWRKTSPDQMALAVGAETLTYEELGRWTDGLAAALAARGIGRGDTVAVTGENSLRWMVAAVAAIKAGGILAGMNHRSVANEFAQMIDRAQSRIIFADRARREVLKRIEDRAFAIEALEEIDTYRDGTAFTPPAIDADDPFLIVFTSGTTGTPKAAIQTHRTYLASAIERQMIEPVYGRNMRQLSVIPLYGNGGAVWGYLNALIRGGTFVLEPRFDPGETLAQIERHGINVFGGVPYFFEQMAAHPAFATARLDTLQSAITGGARVSADVLEKWRSKSVLLRQMYGMTELGICATVSTDEEVLAGAASCGRGGMFTRIRVVREDGTDCAPGEAGEIRVKGPGVVIGYWCDPVGTAALFDEDGWVRTGDVGMLDETGLLTFVDRAKDIIISGGINISPSEIENVILGIEGTIEAAVIGVPDERFGETPMAVIHGDIPDPKAVVAQCNRLLSDYKVPRYVDVVAEPLPRMTSGKIDKQALARLYATRFRELPRLR